MRAVLRAARLAVRAWIPRVQSAVARRARAAALLCLLLPGLATAGERRLCDTADEVFDGRWHLSEQRVSAPEEYCPATLAEIAAKGSPPKHFCSGAKAYRLGTFAHTSCRVRPPERSLRLLLEQCRRQRFVFFGDSITKQMHRAFQCEAERAGVNLSAETQPSRWLWSVPCPEDCSAKDERSACVTCAEGAMKDERSWSAKVPRDTAVLVLGTGLWYNPAKGVAHSDATYAHTLDALVPVLRRFSDRGVLILWLDIPVCVRHCDVYDHHLEAGKNALAAAKLAAVPNLVFLNTSRATAYRKLHQQDVLSDGAVHWCNPGHKSVPAFLIEQMLHVMVSYGACTLAGDQAGSDYGGGD